MSLEYTKIRSEPGTKCDSCPRLLQHGGYLLEWQGASTAPICGWCLAVAADANDKGQIIEKVKDE